MTCAKSTVMAGIEMTVQMETWLPLPAFFPVNMVVMQTLQASCALMNAGDVDGGMARVS